jgi:tetratricopeptide (TPR) repeat protein
MPKRPFIGSLVILVLLASGLVGAASAQDGGAEEAPPSPADPPSAEDVARAEQLVVDGRDLMDAEETEAALESFREAFRLSRAPWALAEVALAEYALGNLVEAEAHFQEVLATEDDPWVLENFEAVQELLAETQEALGTLVIQGGEPGATVVVDGVERGALPVEPLRVIAGPTVILEVNGTERVSRTVRIDPGATATEELPVPTPPDEEEELVVEDDAPTLEGEEAREEAARAALNAGPGPGSIAVLTGAGVFLASYLTTLVYAPTFAASDDLPYSQQGQIGDISAWATVPVLGPFALATFALGEDQNAAGFGFIGLGLGQLIGLGVAVIGLLVGDPDPMEGLEEDRAEEEVAVVPMVDATTAGLSLHRRF